MPRGTHGPPAWLICTLDNQRVGKQRRKGAKHLREAHQGQPFTPRHVAKVMPTANVEETVKEYGENTQLWYIEQTIYREDDLIMQETSQTSATVKAVEEKRFQFALAHAKADPTPIPLKTSWIVITAVLVENSTMGEADMAAQRPGVAPAAVIAHTIRKADSIAANHVREHPIFDREE